jgi:hypothetical protein
MNASGNLAHYLQLADLLAKAWYAFVTSALYHLTATCNRTCNPSVRSERHIFFVVIIFLIFITTEVKLQPSTSHPLQCLRIGVTSDSKLS